MVKGACIVKEGMHGEKRGGGACMMKGVCMVKRGCAWQEGMHGKGGVCGRRDSH